MTGCEGRIWFWYLFACLNSDVFGILDCGNTTVFLDLPIAILKRHINLSRQLPICVLFKGKDATSRLETSLQNLWRNEKIKSNYSTWKFGSFILDKVVRTEHELSVSFPQRVPTLRCYLGETANFDYHEKVTYKRLHKWMKTMVQHHQVKLEEGRERTMTEAVLEGGPVLLGFPDHNTQHLQEILYQVKDRVGDDVRIFSVHHRSTDRRLLLEKYDISQLPAVIYVKRKSDGSQTQKKFTGPQIFSNNLELFLRAQNIPATQLTLENFEAETVSYSSTYVPILVCFYAGWAKDSPSHLSAFHSTVEEFQELNVKMRFGVLDVSAEKIVVSRWIKAEFAAKVPSTLIFHITPATEQVQQTLIAGTPSVPTPLTTYTQLLLLGINLTNHRGEHVVYQPWGMTNPNMISDMSEGPCGIMCSVYSHNTTDNDSCLTNLPPSKKRKSLKFSKKSWNDKMDTLTIESQLDQVYGIPILTHVSWSEVIEKSHKPSSNSQYADLPWRSEITKVTLVIYVMEGCGSCKRNMAVFTELRQSTKYMNGSVYLVNCSADHALCDDQEVRGFPSLVAYRGLNWLRGDHCTTSQAPLIRMDYHGVILVKPIMEWFVKASEEAVHDRKLTKLSLTDMEEDVRLIATLMPRHSQFLPIPPNRNKNYYFPYNCLRLTCERLFNMAGCYTVYSPEIPSTEFTTPHPSEMIVSKVMMQRKDGVDVTLSQLGRSLANTLEDHTGSQVHKFHKPHKYNLRPGVQCEDDHGLCSDLLVTFTMDHARLPVTRMTSTLFHTKNSLFSDGTLPILVAFVYQTNITHGSTFLQTLTSLGYELYGEISVVTVDVEEYPAWTGQFVPLHYHSSVHNGDEEDKPSLYEFPRMCIIDWTDHRHAAFYPSVNISRMKEFLFSSDAIVKFVRDFQSNPQHFLVETENF